MRSKDGVIVLSPRQKRALELFIEWGSLLRADWNSQYYAANALAAVDGVFATNDTLVHSRTVYSLLRLGLLKQKMGRGRLTYELADPIATQLMLLSMSNDRSKSGRRVNG